MRFPLPHESMSVGVVLRSCLGCVSVEAGRLSFIKENLAAKFLVLLFLKIFLAPLLQCTPSLRYFRGFNRGCVPHKQLVSIL